MIFISGNHFISEGTKITPDDKGGGTTREKFKAQSISPFSPLPPPPSLYQANDREDGFPPGCWSLSRTVRQTSLMMPATPSSTRKVDFFTFPKKLIMKQLILLFEQTTQHSWQHWQNRQGRKSWCNVHLKSQNIMSLSTYKRTQDYLRFWHIRHSINIDLTATFFSSSRSFVCGEKVWLFPLLVLGYQRLVFTGGDSKIDCH